MNQISVPERLENELESLRMSNTSMQVFMELLALSGSSLASTDRDKQFVIWLAQRDQNVLGRGTVGFDLEEMPWLPEDFGESKSFLLSVIDGVIARTRWSVLDYEPNEEWVHSRFGHFRRMIEAFEEEDVDARHYLEWSALDDDKDEGTIPHGYPMCAAHGVYLSCLGCIICNADE